MIGLIARAVALLAVAVDLAGAYATHRWGGSRISLDRAALVTAAALLPCGLAFLMVIARHLRAPQGGRRRIRMRLPIRVPRAYAGAAALGMIATLTAMGERFGPYILLAGVALVALALSQAGPRLAG